MRKKLNFIFICLLLIGFLTFTSCTHKKTNQENKETKLEYYTVTFLNSDGTVLYQEKIIEGTVPSYMGEAPTVESTDENTRFIFDCWDKEFEPIYEDTTYTAVYIQEVKYKVVFKNYDGSILETKYVYNGNSVSYSGETPKRDSETINRIKYTYSFSRWNKKLDCVTSDMEVTAVFSSSAYPIDYAQIVSNLKNDVYKKGITDSAGSKYRVISSSSDSTSDITISYGIDNKGFYLGADLKLKKSYQTCAFRLYLPDVYQGNYKCNFVYVGLGSTLYKGIIDGYVYPESYTAGDGFLIQGYDGNIDRDTCIEYANLTLELLVTAIMNKSTIPLTDLGFFEFY